MPEGVFAVHRGVFKHPRFEGEAYSRRDAWLWLVGNAAFAECQVRAGHKIVTLQRGQLSYSLRFMADLWGWSVKRVRTFLDGLKTDTMIGTQGGTEQTLITICNYDSYQFDTGDKAQRRARKGARKGHSEGTNNNNDKNDNNDTNNISGASRPKIELEFEEVRKVYPKRIPATPPKPARLKYEAARKRGVPHETILNGARAYATDCDRLERTGTRYVQRLDVWLNQEGWAAYEQNTGPPLPADPIARRDAIRKQIEAENAAKQATGAGCRTVLAGGDGIREEEQSGPKKSGVVCHNGGGYTEPTRSMVKLFSGALGVPAVGGADVEEREDQPVSNPRRVA